ncbi:MAG: hypothetical protein OJF59_000001, partial [Cytophagales bacterium]
MQLSLPQKPMNLVRQVFRPGLFFLFSFFVFCAASYGQTTTWTNGNADFDWSNAANWSNGLPGTGSSVIINGNTGSPLINVSTINLNSLTINSNCVFSSLNGNDVITISGAFALSSGISFQLGNGAGTRFNTFIIASGATASIAGTFTIDAGGLARTFQNNGDVSIPAGGLLTGGAGSTFTLSSSATLRIGSNAGITSFGAIGSVQVLGTRSYSTGANYVYNGAANQAVGSGLPATVASLTIANTGGGGNNTVTLASSINITNSLTVSSGAFALGSNNVNTVGSINMTGTSISGSGTISLNGNITTNASATTSVISAPINLNGATRTLNVGSGGLNPDLSITSVISGANVMNMAGPGVLSLSGASTYSGGTTVSAGTLVLGAANPVGSGSVTVNSGATLDLNGRNLSNNLSINGTGVASGGALKNSGAAAAYSGLLSLAGNASIVANSGAINITNVGNIIGSGNNLTLDGNGGGSIASIIATGAGSVTKSGTGAWTLSGANTFTGGLTLNSGTVNINNANALGNASGTFTINGGSIDNTTGGAITLVNYPQQWNGDFTFNGTRNLNLGNGNVTLGSDRVVSVNSNTLTVGGVVSAAPYSLTKSGAGTLAFAAGDVTVNNLGINAGTLTAPTGNLNIAGNFSNSGTFNNNNGTVNYNGSSPQSIASVTYYNLTCSGAGSKGTGSNITVSNALTNSTVLDMAGNTLSFGSVNNTGGTIRFSGAANGLAIPSGTIEYYGSSQSITSGTYNGLTITQSSGNASLNAATTINGTLTINTGNLVLGANNLILGASASISISAPSATKMIVASGTGEVRKTYTSTGSFTFPIGDATPNYSPVTVNVTSASGFAAAYVGASVVNTKHPNNSSTTNFLKRYWNINQSGITGCVATISANYVPGDINGTETSIKSAQLNGVFNQNTNPWIKFVALGGNTFTTSGATITAGQVSAFTGITGADPTVSISGAAPICSGGAGVTITANPVGDATFVYSWSPATGLSSTTISNPTANPATTTTYTITVKDGNGIAATSNAL